MEIKFYNTLTRKKEIFKSIKKNEVGLYTCGPTVYWYQHIGNMRYFIFSDILKRTLLYNNYKVKQIINITDVGHLTNDSDDGEDKIEIASRKEGKSAKEISEYYFSVFKKDLEKLNIIFPHKWTKATEHIKEQIELIKKLEKKGYTYKTSDGIYFYSSRFKDYGKFAKLKIEGLEAGKRISLGERKNKTDFALWKFSQVNEKRQQEWDSPWGVGFPGWHIECSAMSMKYLGETIDIHTGGEDHIPIHHTNEIAQSECATGKKFVNYWMHVAFLVNKNGEKISKSKGGLYTISELEKEGFSPLHYRYYCLLTHYKKPLQFSLENLESAKNSYEKIKRKIIEIKKEKHKGKDFSEAYEKEFNKTINDDLNISLAIQVFWKVLDDFDFSSKDKIKLLEKFDSVLGLGIKDFEENKEKVPTKIKELISQRENFRRDKKFQEADKIRNKINKLGYFIEDMDENIRVIKI